MAGLVPPEQIAGAPDLQVAQGDLEPGAELGVVADGPQALVGLFGEHPVDRVEQVGVGPLSGPAHPAPELVELAQPQQVGPVDHQRVDRRHVDPRLDDRRAHEDVVAALPEVEDHLLERALVHLPVGHGHPCLGGHLLDPLGDRLDVLDPVVDVEDLALAQELAPDGLRGRRLPRTRRHG